MPLKELTVVIDALTRQYSEHIARLEKLKGESTTWDPEDVKLLIKILREELEDG